MAVGGIISWICCILFILSCNGFIMEPSKGEPLRQLPRVGIFYSMWHSYAYHAQQTVTQNGGKLITIEDLIRSNNKLKMNDIYEKYHVSNSHLFYYHTKPEAGSYCIYRKRPGESGHLPDCPDIESTLRRHAKQITEAGVDFVLADLTNLGMMSTQADVINYRPLEVLCEEWKKLRDQGIVTPDIAAWLPLSSGDNAWRTALSNVYANSSYEDLILKHNGRKVIHGVASKALDPSIVSQLEANGITMVHNWANLPVSKYSKEGYWRMMSPCMGPKGQYSTSVVDADCSPVMTRNSPLGTMFPVTKTFQTGYASIPWQAAGTLSGLTFKKQMKAALAAQPDYLFVSGWNELIAQPQANHYTGKVDTYWSMGLENCVTKPSSYSANQKDPLWVDLYGEEFHRDFEPTIYNGDKYYKLLQSCIRVFRSKATTCSNKNEECCNMATSDIYTNVFSMYNQGAHDSLLTTDPNERAILLRSGWREHCTYFNPGDSILCHDSHNRAESNTQFIIFKRPGHNRKALYRCYTGSIHFFSPDAKCEGYTGESLLGYVSTVITSETPRSLNRCAYPNNQHVHALDHACPPGSHTESLLGYVR